MNYVPFSQSQNQNYSYQAAQYFPQPQGNVYFVNNSLEVANIPMGSGVTVVLCPVEQTMYLKTLQGGIPSLIAYSIMPYEHKETSQQETPNYGNQIAELAKQIELIKKQLGGRASDSF